LKFLGQKSKHNRICQKKNRGLYTYTFNGHLIIILVRNDVLILLFDETFQFICVEILLLSFHKTRNTSSSARKSEGWVDASFERVSFVTRWARTDGLVVPDVTVSQFTANRSSHGGTSRLAVVCVASFRRTTVAWSLTFSSLARDKRVSNVTSRAGTHRSWFSRTISTRGTISTGSAWVGVAQIGFSEWSAGFERMTCVSTRTRANGFVVFNFAVGTRTASAYAGVNTTELETGLA